MLRKNALYTKCFLSPPVAWLKAVWTNRSTALVWSSKGVLRFLLMACSRSDASSAIRSKRVHRARMMWASLGPRAKLLARPVKQAWSWRMHTGAGHSAMVATSSNSQMNCSTSPSSPKIGGLRRSVPVTKWRLTSPLNFSEDCHLCLNSEGWSLWHFKSCSSFRPCGHLVILVDT